jgi:hypothetical protein
MNRNEYNGWTNFETWLANIWITNDEGTTQMIQEQIDDLIETAVLQDRDDSEIVEVVAEMLELELERMVFAEGVPQASLTSDLLNSAINEINARELAHAFIEWGTVEEKRAEQAELEDINQI